MNTAKIIDSSLAQQQQEQGLKMVNCEHKCKRHVRHIHTRTDTHTHTQATLQLKQ